MSTDNTEPRYAKNLDELAEALEITREQLDKFRETEWFPKSDDPQARNSSKAWNVDYVKTHILEKSGHAPVNTSVAALPEDNVAIDLPRLVEGKDIDGNSILRIESTRVHLLKCPNDNSGSDTGLKKHSTRLKNGGVKGRTRYCVCDTCGTDFQIVADYADIRMDLLHRVDIMFRDVAFAKNTIDGEEVEFCVISKKAVQNLRHAIEVVRQRNTEGTSRRRVTQGV